MATDFDVSALAIRNDVPIPEFKSGGKWTLLLERLIAQGNGSSVLLGPVQARAFATSSKKQGHAIVMRTVDGGTRCWYVGPLKREPYGTK